MMMCSAGEKNENEAKNKQEQASKSKVRKHRRGQSKAKQKAMQSKGMYTRGCTKEVPYVTASGGS